MNKNSGTAFERFSRNVNVNDPSGCHLWTSGTKAGYGYLSVNKRWTLAHRYSWELKRGPIPKGMFVCHACDVPACVNPDHLFLGTSADNMRDMAAKGRSTHGKRNQGAKLTEQDVIAIRGDRRVQQVIADEYGVWQGTISAIQRGQKWSRVGGEIQIRR